MSEERRRAYRTLAQLFLVVGGVFAALALLQRAGAITWFQGDPLGVALLVLVIGIALWWTVRTALPPAPDDDDERGDGSGGADGGNGA